MGAQTFNFYRSFHTKSTQRSTFPTQPNLTSHPFMFCTCPQQPVILSMLLVRCSNRCGFENSCRM